MNRIFLQLCLYHKKPSSAQSILKRLDRCKIHLLIQAWAGQGSYTCDCRKEGVHCRIEGEENTCRMPQGMVTKWSYFGGLGACFAPQHSGNHNDRLAEPTAEPDEQRDGEAGREADPVRLLVRLDCLLPPVLCTKTVTSQGGDSKFKTHGNLTCMANYKCSQKAGPREADIS